ncbi:MAG: hypothetical protein EOO77_22815 [Oxalobacteraceae bacterium]|nr:MAG: hypothetical protein EOO77_22815 [Oxalobacteraceae bacterium]
MTNLVTTDQPTGLDDNIVLRSSRGEVIAGKPPLFGSASARAALGMEAEAYVARASEMMDRARAIVHSDRVRAIDLLQAKRVRLCEHFTRYQRFKHTQIFNPIIVHAPASSKVVARTMKIDCMELGETFAAYHNRWLGMRPKEWPAYRRDMLSTTEMMQTSINAEIRAIRQLLMISDLYAD